MNLGVMCIQFVTTCLVFLQKQKRGLILNIVFMVLATSIAARENFHDLMQCL